MELLLNLEIFAPEPFGVGHLLVAGGEVVWLGHERPELPGSLEVRVTDFQGCRALPGLIDCHVHVTGGGGESGPVSRVPPVAAREFIKGGVTTMVGLLGTDDTTRDPASLLATTRGLRQQGLSAYCLTGGYRVPPVTLTGDVRKDIVHLDPVIGVGEVAISDHRSSQPSLRELLRLAADAHVAGMMAGKAGILHLHVGDGDRGLEMVRAAMDASELPPRVFHPTHVNRRKALFEEAVELARRGSTVDLTAFPVADGEDAWSAAEGLMRYLDSGAPPERITVSSDSGGCLPVFDEDGRIIEMDVGRPGALLQTIAELISAGRELPEVLPAFTANVARILRLPRKGRLAPGADADIIIIDQEGALRDVMAAGSWHMRSGSLETHSLSKAGNS